MAGEAQTQTNDQTVPKTELDKVAAQNAELSKNLESLKGQLLSEEYLQYLADKKAGKQAAAPQQAGNTNVPLQNLTLAQLQQVIAAQLGQTLEPVIKQVYGKINELGAKQELDEVRGKYEDFGEFQDKVVAILEGTPNTELTIEQAYLIAKAGAINEQQSKEGQEGQEGQQGSKQEKTVSSNEKPGGTVPLSGESAQQFKSAEDAGHKAWAEVRQKYGLTGDTI